MEVDWWELIWWSVSGLTAILGVLLATSKRWLPEDAEARKALPSLERATILAGVAAFIASFQVLGKYHLGFWDVAPAVGMMIALAGLLLIYAFIMGVKKGRRGPASLGPQPQAEQNEEDAALPPEPPAPIP